MQIDLLDYRNVRRRVRRHRVGRDDRGRRRISTGPPTSGCSTRCSRRVEGLRCRRSPCRTIGCSRPATPTPGCTSTSSPAGSCPSTEAIEPHRRAHVAAGAGADEHGTALRGDAAAVGGAVRRAQCAGGGARIRRDVPSHVALLPLLLGGRLPVGVSSTSSSSSSTRREPDRGPLPKNSTRRCVTARPRRTARASDRVGRQHRRTGDGTEGGAPQSRRAAPIAVEPGRTRSGAGLCDG